MFSLMIVYYVLESGVNIKLGSNNVPKTDANLV